MTKDPVCSMPIDEQTAARKIEYLGKTYYFCSPACQRAFEKQPEKYASQ